MTEIGYFTPPTAGFVNRSTPLLVVGILFIIAGAIAGCMGLLAPVGILVQQRVAPAGAAPSQSVANIVTALLLYALISALLLTLGVGAVRKRRWVRPIILAGSWMLLVMGILGLAMLAFRAPGMAEGMRQSMAATPGTPAPPPAMVNIMLSVMLLFALFFYLVLPVLLIWLFRDDDIRATLEHYDAKPRWTDRLPLPVLILVLALALSSLASLAMIAQGWCPVFGSVIYAAPAAAVMIAVALLFAIATYLTYRLHTGGWWMALVLWLVLGASWVTTLLHADMHAVYQHAGMSQQQLDLMDRMHTFPDTTVAVTTAISVLVAIVFTLRVRRFFTAPESAAMG